VFALGAHHPLGLVGIAVGLVKPRLPVFGDGLEVRNVADEVVNLTVVQARRFDGDVGVVKQLNLNREEVVVPLALGDPVVRDPRGPDFGLGEIRLLNDGDVVEPELLRGLVPTVAFDSRPGAADDDGLVPSEPADRRGDLVDLLGRVILRVLALRDDTVERPYLNVVV